MDQDKTFAQLMGENKSGHDPDVRKRSRRAGYPIVESATMDEGTADALLAMIVEVPRYFKEDE